LISEKTAVLYKGRNIFEIDISGLITGIYFYKISLDGINKKTGKIYLIK